MFAKRPAPVIGKLPNSFMSGGITSWDASTSPKSPLECKILSPRGPINCDLTGIGLGIVVAMEKHSDPSKTHVLANKSSSGHRNKIRSDPVPVNPLIVGSRKRHTEEKKKQGSLEDNHDGSDLDSDSGSDQIQKKKIDYDCRRRSNSKWNQTSCPVDDFLSNCHMCQKKLHGKDIYMYRGEKGYCSTECRLKQIMMDENKEKYCKSTVTTSRSVQVSSSPCQNGSIFFSHEILVHAK